MAGWSTERAARAANPSSGAAAAAPAPAGAAASLGRGRSGRPLRFVSVYVPHGRARELWTPGPDFDIAYPGAILAPFDDAATFGSSFKDQLVVLEGIDLSAGIAVGTSGHDGSRTILTGSGANGRNASLDQYLAIEQGLGQDTAFSSITLAVGNEGTELGENIAYAPGGSPLPKWIDPSVTFGELFGRTLAAGDPERAERLRRGQSVLDLVRADLRSLGARAPASERHKLDLHATSLRDIEKRLTLAPPACRAPDAPRPFERVRAYGGGETHFDAITDLQIDLMVRAMACDLTRFGTLRLADLSRTGLVTGFPNDVHTDVAHCYDARTDNHPGTPESWAKLAVQNRYCMTKVARLLAGLRDAGLLEDTIVYVSGDMGDTARHSSRDVPTLLAGGAGGRLRMGQHLQLGATGSEPRGVPNNRVLVSIAQAFGVETDHFGHADSASITQGRVSELHSS